MDPDFTYWTTIISLFIAGISCLSTIIATIPSFMQIIYKLKTNNTNNKVNVRELLSNIKKHKFEIFMFVTIILLSGVLILQLRQLNPPEKPHIPGTENKNDTCNEQDTTPLLVFAGGGSVRNYLLELDSTILDINNSINIAMASGSAWRVLSEEYHNSGRFNEFNTICLSATKIDTSGNFYKEYISYLDNVIVVEVYLGEDPLVAYVSDSLMKYWGWNKNKDYILLDTLAQRLQMIVEKNEKNISIFSTNKTSGTLEQYKKSFQELKDKQDSMMLQDSIEQLNSNTHRDTGDTLIERIKKSIETRSFVNLEKMIDDGRALTYYDKTPSNSIYTRYGSGNSSNSKSYDHFIILGSKYYKVENLNDDNITKLNIINNQNTKIQKSMYLYFLATSNTKDCYLVKDNIIEFLKKIEEKIKNKNKVWDTLKHNKIIKFDSSIHKEGKIVTVNKK